jgi:four helix bundle protein
MPDQSPIFVKTEAFLVWLLDHTRKFPKHERFRLAQYIEEAAFTFHTNLIRAAHSETPREALHEADIELARLRAYLRLALELRYTSHGQYGYAAQQTAEIGRLLGGWLKSLRD